MYIFCIQAKKVTRNVSKTSTRKSRNNNEKSSEQSSSSDLVRPEEDEEIKLDFISIEKELLQESTNEVCAYQDTGAFILHISTFTFVFQWEVGTINVSRRFRQYQIEVLEKAKSNGLKWSDL